MQDINIVYLVILLQWDASIACAVAITVLMHNKLHTSYGIETQDLMVIFSTPGCSRTCCATAAFRIAVGICSSDHWMVDHSVLMILYLENWKKQPVGNINVFMCVVDKRPISCMPT